MPPKEISVFLPFCSLGVAVSQELATQALAGHRCLGCRSEGWHFRPGGAAASQGPGATGEGRRVVRFRQFAEGPLSAPCVLF